MDTPSKEETIEPTTEIDTIDTSETAQEDADTKRIADKKAYLAKLDREIKEKEATRNNARPEDQDDVITWMTLNGDDLKLVAKEYQEELSFYKSHKIPVTNDIRDRALQSARNRKGVRPTVERQASEVTTETRKVAKSDEIPAAIKKANPNMTQAQYLQYKAEFDAKKK